MSGKGNAFALPREISPLTARNILPAISSASDEPFDDNVIINYTRESPFFPDEIAKPQFVWLTCITGETGSKNRRDFVEPRITRRSFFPSPGFRSVAAILRLSSSSCSAKSGHCFEDICSWLRARFPRNAPPTNASVRPLRRIAEETAKLPSGCTAWL